MICKSMISVVLLLPALALGNADFDQRHHHHHHHKKPVVYAPAPASAAEPPDPVKTDAHDAHKAAKVAKQAAKVANRVAEHSIKVTGHAKKALTHALGALHDARVETSGLNKGQKASLKKAEAHLREATKKADFGKLKKVKDAEDLKKEKMQDNLDDKKKSSMTEEEKLLHEVEQLREMLKEKDVDDKDINKALDDLEASIKREDGISNDEAKSQLERLRELIAKLEKGSPTEKETAAKIVDDVQSLESGGHGKGTHLKKEGQEEDKAKNGETVATPVEEKGIDIDTQMPYGDLEPFGREDTAQELTEKSITESDQMVDQLERAEVAEEKRAVFRALTRLRGAAITSYDGVARSQTGNIDEYNKVQKWRKHHPLHHLADEESDVTKWAFPDNAD